MQRAFPLKSGKPGCSSAESWAFPAKYASNFELNGLMSGEASNAAIAIAMASNVSETRERSAGESFTTIGVWFGPGTSDPIRVFGLLFGTEHTASTSAGHGIWNAPGPRTSPNSGRYRPSETPRTIHAGSRFPTPEAFPAEPG